MNIESMTPAAGNILPSQSMNKRSGYSRGGRVDDIIMAEDYYRGLEKIANSKMSPAEKKSAISELKRRLREQKKPYKH
jgi:hypothetical protein